MAFSLTTRRLILDDLTRGDLHCLHRIARDSTVMKFVLIWFENDEQIAAFLQHAIDESIREDPLDYVLAIRTRENRAFAGFASIEVEPNQRTTAEVGCVLAPEYWGDGYALEIIRALLAFGFDKLCLHRIFGKCDDLNLASARVLEKCGLTYEGTIREHVWLRDHWRSTRYFGMLAEEWLEETGGRVHERI
jgi:[ribosomal protein S5]-alanine N-acetyltransferase